MAKTAKPPAAPPPAKPQAAAPAQEEIEFSATGEILTEEPEGDEDLAAALEQAEGEQQEAPETEETEETEEGDEAEETEAEKADDDVVELDEEEEAKADEAGEVAPEVAKVKAEIEVIRPKAQFGENMSNAIQQDKAFRLEYYKHLERRGIQLIPADAADRAQLEVELGVAVKPTAAVVNGRQWTTEQADAEFKRLLRTNETEAHRFLRRFDDALDQAATMPQKEAQRKYQQQQEAQRAQAEQESTEIAKIDTDLAILAKKLGDKYMVANPKYDPNKPAGRDNRRVLFANDTFHKLYMKYDKTGEPPLEVAKDALRAMGKLITKKKAAQQQQRSGNRPRLTPPTVKSGKTQQKAPPGMTSIPVEVEEVRSR